MFKKIRSCGNCSDSSTTEREGEGATYKNVELDARVYDLNQNTMQALDILAKECELFEKTMKKVTFEIEGGPTFCT